MLMLLLSGFQLSAQRLNFQLQSAWEYSFTYTCLTALLDDRGQPYIYSANKELGFIEFDISDPAHITAIDTMLPAAFGGLKPTNAFQLNNYLFLSLGDFQGSTQNAGLAILNISDPHNVFIEDRWDSAFFDQGSAVVFADSNYAYLGCMESGVVLLDVSDKSNIRFVSFIKPDPNWPIIPGPFTTPNSRGLTVRNDTVYVSNDAGGLRILDYTDKHNPQEIGQYINHVMDSVAQLAYNNVLLIGKYAYLTVDYCGLEVVDISDPDTIRPVRWLNPWGCTTTNWNGRPGHTNQLVYLPGPKILFVSGGDTELLAYDVSDPTNPVEIGSYYTLNDLRVAWGVDANDSYVSLAYIDNPVGVPYQSNYGGVQLLSWADTTVGIEQPEKTGFKIFPNPNTGQFLVELPTTIYNGTLQVTNLNGQRLYGQSFAGQTIFNLHLDLPKGLYFVQVQANTGSTFVQKLVVQ